MSVVDRRGFTFRPTPEQLSLVRRELKFTPQTRCEYGAPKRGFVAYTLNADGSVTVPRAWGIRTIGGAASGFGEGGDIDEATRLLDGFRLDSARSQDLAVEAVTSALSVPVERGGGLGLVSLPCGGGKTVLFIYVLIRVVRKRALVVVHTNQLADQWEERFAAFCPGVRIGRVQGATVTVAGCDVVICMLQTLSMKEDLAPSLFDDFSVMAIDECHLVCTETFSRLLTRWGVKFMFGLSATPTRRDGLEGVLFAHLGGLVYSGVRERVPLRVVFEHPDVSGCKELMNPRTRKPDHVGMISGLVGDEARTRLIAARAVEHRRTKVLVLSERREHLERIMHHIVAIDPACASDVGLYRGKMKPEELKASEGRSIILGTYSIASVGLDIKGLNTLILATPRSDVVQASGRIQRDVSPLFGKQIIDFYDRFSVFTGQYAKRLHFYRESQFEIAGAPAKRPREPAPTGALLRIDTALV